MVALLSDFVSDLAVRSDPLRQSEGRKPSRIIPFRRTDTLNGGLVAVWVLAPDGRLLCHWHKARPCGDIV